MSRLRRDQRLVDRLLTVAALVAVEVNLFTATNVDGPLALNAVVLAAMAATLLWRTRRPLVCQAAYSAGMLVLSIFLTWPPNLSASIFVLMLISFSVGAHTEGRDSYVGLGIALATVVVVSIIVDPGDIVFPALFFGFLPWLIGRTLRTQLLLTRELAEKAEMEQHAREEDERRAIAAERARIARELHDVLAHDLSVMVIQAAGARRSLPRQPERATEAAHLIERTGREALVELRRLFGTVRRSDGALDEAGGLAGLKRLAARARAAGMDVDVRVEGESSELSHGLDLAVHRVVQEALTNAYKHAGGAAATVVVRFGEAALEVEVVNARPAAPAAPVPGGGHGLVGMRERVSVYGGALETGPAPGGGWAVRAELPLAPEAEATRRRSSPGRHAMVQSA